MTTKDERIQILKMIENRTITAEEGARLLEAIDQASAREQSPTSAKARWLRVRVTDIQSGRNKVNVTIPIGLVNVGLRMGAKFAPDIGSVDIDEIIKAVKDGAQGKIVDAEDLADGERVEIYVE